MVNKENSLLPYLKLTLYLLIKSIVTNSFWQIRTELSVYSGGSKLNFLQVSANIVVGLFTPLQAQYPDLKKQKKILNAVSLTQSFKGH